MEVGNELAWKQEEDNECAEDKCSLCVHVLELSLLVGRSLKVIKSPGPTTFNSLIQKLTVESRAQNSVSLIVWLFNVISPYHSGCIRAFGGKSRRLITTIKNTGNAAMKAPIQIAIIIATARSNVETRRARIGKLEVKRLVLKEIKNNDANQQRPKAVKFSSNMHGKSGNVKI